MKTQPSIPAGQANKGALLAGASVADLTPQRSMFLFGYPHVPRMSTGTHDPLECAALFLRQGEGSALFLANDTIGFSRQFVADVRRRIFARTGVPEEAVMITATHTHSGPVTMDFVSNAADPVVPKADQDYLRWVADRMVGAACSAVQKAVPAELGLAMARAEGVGSNRHDPAGPADPEVPVLVARSLEGQVPLACMVVYAMHPTVLHEDSTLFSADFPYFTRRLLRQSVLPASCPVLYHNGAAGNQSPRHMTRANTFAEAQRLGENLGQSIAGVIPSITFRPDARVACRRGLLDLKMRKFSAPAEAEKAVQTARDRFEQLKREAAPRQAVRTAECDVFGAEETAVLARAATDGRLAEAVRNCMPAEIQVIEVGPWKFVAWPGEFFVEYALAVRALDPKTFIITLANGELQGYIATPEAAAKGLYESTNAVFEAGNGEHVVEATLALLKSGK